MPKLLRIDPGQAKEVTHTKCGAVISYFEREVQSAIYHDYGGGSDTWYWITCPNCEEKMEVGRPKHL